jgi:predicted dehydrogenase
MPPAFITRPALLSGPDPDPLRPTGRPLRWGVVATGRIAGTVAQDLALMPDAVRQAVSSRTPSRAGPFADRFGFATWYADDAHRTGCEKLLADPGIDVVYVATPHAQHHAVARAALRAGKHVLCEKPFTINAREAKDLVNLARARGLFLMEAVWTRFLPGMQRAWDIAGSGELGVVWWVNAELGFPAPPDPAARIWARHDGGGALLDLAVYPMLWAWGTLGLPDQVTATGTLTDEGVDAQNTLVLSYACGAQAQLTTSLLASSPHSAVVSGSEGWLRAQGFHSVYDPTRLDISSWGELRTEAFPHPSGTGRLHQLREVTRCIQHGIPESPTMPLHDTLAMMRIFDNIRAQIGVRYPNDDNSPPDTPDIG